MVRSTGNLSSNTNLATMVTEWRRTGINFAETSGQRHPDEDMLRDEEGHIINKLKCVMFLH